MKEIWKDVEGYEGYYRISNFGSVIGLDRVFEKIFFDKKVKVKLTGVPLKTTSKKEKIITVTLSKNGLCEKVNLARLVAKHFVDNPNNFKCISHKDGNKLNCRADNLEWGKHPVNNTLKKSVRISKDGFVKEFNSKQECCDFFDCTHRCLNYRRKLFGNKFDFKGYLVELN